MNIIFYIILALIFLYLISDFQKKTKLINLKKEEFHQDVRGKKKEKSNLKYLDRLFGLDTEYEENVSDITVNPEYIEVQFHNDYRDVLTAFNNIAPSQKQIFNQANIPVLFTTPLSQSKKDTETVTDIVKDFVNEINYNIKNEVGDYRNGNSGWDEYLEDPKFKNSGWEEHMEKLGLPKSIYPEAAKQSHVTLLKIDHIEKYETDDEIKYVIYMFLAKDKVEDQIVVKLTVVLDKRFKNEANDIQKLIIEDIFVLGFLVRKGIGRINQLRDDFYNFKSLDKEGILDQGHIMKELMLKYNQRMSEMNHFTASLDDEFKEHRMQVPNLSNFDAYQSTQTIVDDLFKDKTFY